MVNPKFVAQVNETTTWSGSIERELGRGREMEIKIHIIKNKFELMFANNLKGKKLIIIKLW